MTSEIPATDTAPTDAQTQLARLREHVSSQVLGQERLVERMLVALLADGHILVEGAPGLAKTRAINVLSRGIEGDFHRIQFTPDLLPADLTGTEIYRPQDGSFHFQSGPLFHNLVLADEINRSPAKVQSALLEAMAERQITVGRVTYKLPELFMVMATQNPIEQEGTYPLPEAQLDRFLLKIKLGYPSSQEEASVLSRFQQASPLDDLPCVLSSKDLLDLQHICRKVYVETSVREYIVAVTRATREHSEMKLGASPRAALGLQASSQAFAAIQGRNYVIPDDVKYLAGPVLSHRTIARTEAVLKGRSSEQIIEEILSTVPVPVE